jgi:hypothetical protein
LFEPLAIGSQKLDFQKLVCPWVSSVPGATFATAFPIATPTSERPGTVEAGRCRLCPSEKGPYLALLDYGWLTNSASWPDHEKDLPAWADLVFRFKQVRLQAKADGKGRQSGRQYPRKKRPKRYRPKSGGLESGARCEIAPMRFSFEERMAAGKAFNQYQEALNSLMPMTDSRKIAFKMASELVQRRSGGRRIGLFQGPQRPKTTSGDPGAKKKDTEVFWNLVNGPIRFYHEYAAREAQCQLQHLWEKMFIWKCRICQGAAI